MARNTLSRAERYHPREKKKQITTKQSPSLCNFLLHYVCRSCPRSLELTSWQKTWAGMRRRSGSKACSVSLIYSFIVLLSFLGNFQKRAQIQNLVSKYRAYAKRQWQSQNTNEQTKQTKKTYNNNDWFWQITNHYARVDQTDWYCEQLQTISLVSTKTGSDKPTVASSETQGLKPFVTLFLSIWP